MKSLVNFYTRVHYNELGQIVAAGGTMVLTLTINNLGGLSVRENM